MPVAPIKGEEAAALEMIAALFIHYWQTYGVDRAEGIIAGLVKLSAQMEAEGKTVQ